MSTSSSLWSVRLTRSRGMSRWIGVWEIWSKTTTGTCVQNWFTHTRYLKKCCSCFEIRRNCVVLFLRSGITTERSSRICSCVWVGSFRWLLVSSTSSSSSFSRRSSRRSKFTGRNSLSSCLPEKRPNWSCMICQPWTEIFLGKHCLAFSAYCRLLPGIVF